MKRDRRLKVSIMLVALGVTLFLAVGPVIISLFGFTYKTFDNTWLFRPPEISGTTPLFWVGTVVGFLGFAMWIGGLVGVVVYYLKKW